MIDITERNEDGLTVIEPRGKIDTLTAKAFEAHLKRHIDEGTGPVVIDMSGVDYVSSFGLRSLLVAAKQLAPAGRKYVLFALQPPVHDVLRISGFLKIIAVVGSVGEAQAMIGPQGQS